MLNELIHEITPYSDAYRAGAFAGRGANAIADYAARGGHPVLAPSAPPALKALITSCWAADPAARPSFDELSRQLREISFPSSVDVDVDTTSPDVQAATVA